MTLDKKTSSQLLERSWLHSHEEDSQDEMVYRPSDFSFPPSRGRAGFELGPNHECVEIGIAPADGATHSQGTWRLNEGDELVICSRPDSGTEQVLKICELQADRLIVKKPRQ